MRKYILIDGIPTPEPDILKWSQWFEGSKNRIVKQDKKNDVLVSTIFLGIDHGPFVGRPCKNGDRPSHDPVLWETMIFEGPHNGKQERYSSLQDALDGHKKLCAIAFNS